MTTLMEGRAIRIKKERVNQFLEALSGLDYRDSMALLTVGLSLIYRGDLESDYTILEFIDVVNANIKSFIQNPPQGFNIEVEVTDQCDCPACELRRMLETVRMER